MIEVSLVIDGWAYAFSVWRVPHVGELFTFRGGLFRVWSVTSAGRHPCVDLEVA